MQNVFRKGRVILVAAAIAVVAAGGFLRVTTAQEKPDTVKLDTVVAKVNGHAMGGGLGLVAASTCAGARFGSSITKLRPPHQG